MPKLKSKILVVDDNAGIGLSLSRQIMIKHHGDIRLEQSDESMTIFAVIFK